MYLLLNRIFLKRSDDENSAFFDISATWFIRVNFVNFEQYNTL